jgi:ABC-type branched-subunit amino acid transport system permease subunit
VFVNAANPTVRGKGLTGGPNGIADIDPNDLFGYELTTRRQQYWFLLGVVLLVLVGLYLVWYGRFAIDPTKQGSSPFAWVEHWSSSATTWLQDGGTTLGLVLAAAVAAVVALAVAATRLSRRP